VAVVANKTKEAGSEASNQHGLNYWIIDIVVLLFLVLLCFIYCFLYWFMVNYCYVMLCLYFQERGLKKSK
jgi:hypothetical protein